MSAQEQEKPTPRKRHRLRRWLLGIVLTLVLLPFAIVGALYIPGVLNLVAYKVLPSIEQSSGLRIQADNISLRWPMRLNINNALVTDLKAGGDTMLSAQKIRVAVNPLPLLGGRISVSNAVVQNAFYQMGGTDSLYLSALIDSIGASADIALNFEQIDVDHADLNGARVKLIMGPDTTETPKDTTSATRLKIISGPISIRNLDYTMSMALTNDTISAIGTNANLSGGSLTIDNDLISILAGTLNVDLASALYGTRGAVDIAGFNPEWITADSASARVDSFAMTGMNLTVPLTYLKIKDVAGMSLNGSGVFSMTDSTLRAEGFDILLDRSRLAVSAEMGLDSVPSRAPLSVDAAASVYPGDVVSAFPAYAPLLKPLNQNKPLHLRALASGTMEALNIDSIMASMEGVFALGGSGKASNFTNPANMQVNALFSGKLVNSAPFADMIPKGVKIPPLALKGHARINGTDYQASLTARTGAGRLALDGRLAGKAPDYKVNLRVDSFPVAAFMPDLGIGAVSGTIFASGSKFNPLLPGASLAADANIRGIQFHGKNYGGVTLQTTLSKGDLAANLASTIPAANLSAELLGHVRPKDIDWNFNADIRRLDLLALGLSDSVMNGQLALSSSGFMTLNTDSLNATATLRNASLALGSNALAIDSLSLRANAGIRHTELELGNAALNLDFNAQAALMPLIDSISAAALMASHMIDARNFAADSLSSTLPPLTLNLRALPGNVIADYLRPSGIDFSTLSLHAANDSIITAKAQILGLQSGSSLTIDTITANLRSRGQAMLLDIDMDNRPGTFDEFAKVCLRGSVSGNTANLFLQQQNIQGKIGYLVGARIAVADSLIELSLTPDEPVIAYKHWKVNSDNFIAVNPYTYFINANLDAHGDGSRLQLLTANRAETDSLNALNALTLKISDIHIQDWLQINPFAPPIAGDVSADLQLNYTTKSVNGLGTASLTNLTYGRKPVGNFNLDLNVATDFGGSIKGKAALKINDKPAMVMAGALNDTTFRSPLNMIMRLTEFPLEVANPFLPPEFASLSGSLNGRMGVHGTFNAMKLNGRLNFNEAKIFVPMMGSSFTLDSVAIPVDTNFVRFNNFAIYGSNSNPLRLNGAVDIRRFADPRIDLALKAENMQFLNSKKAKHVELYGKGYLNLDATVRGSMQFMKVDANLAILPQTNLTYQVTDAKAVAGLQPESKMVRFVNFADTAAVTKSDTITPQGMLMMLSALVDIRQGSTFTVDLSADGKNRAQIKGEGILDYTMTPTQPDGRLTGRFTINSGFFRYSLPVISEKLFTFNPGSYVAFNGPLLNPTLNVSAYDEVRANVTRQGENSRLVDFDVSLAATGSLERMDVAFDLSTKDDITVQNELQSMSATQRANQAMNLLLYGVYTGQGTTGNANLSGNALYGFLTSQLNTWAANTIKGVDISFGMDQYDRTRDGNTSTATQYSYQVSKSLFNDRFKIVVGGNYSTDADAQDNIAENLISDVSFEYMLNDSGSMYVRLFRHTGYESILEGEVTQTGVGFVVKRKIRRLADIFNFIKAAKQ